MLVSLVQQQHDDEISLMNFQLIERHACMSGECIHHIMHHAKIDLHQNLHLFIHRLKVFKSYLNAIELFLKSLNSHHRYRYHQNNRFLTIFARKKVA